jgi:hypothetical protein
LLVEYVVEVQLELYGMDLIVECCMDKGVAWVADDMRTAGHLSKALGDTVDPEADAQTS